MREPASAFLSVLSNQKASHGIDLIRSGVGIRIRWVRFAIFDLVPALGEQLDGGNPELLQMAHYFASAQDNYLEVMQGFALLYTALLMQSEADRLSVH